jgi:hypothetical protein
MTFTAFNLMCICAVWLAIGYGLGFLIGRMK